MDYEKFKSLLRININERTTDDINAIDIKFAKCCNNSEIFYEVCQNVELKKYEIDEEIMNSENNTDENFLLLKGEVNYYELVMENNIKKSIILKTILKGEEFGSFEVALANDNLAASSIKNFTAVANCDCEIAVFKDINKKHELKTMISKKIQKNKKKKNANNNNNSNNNTRNQINDETRSLKNKDSNDKNSLLIMEKDIKINLSGDKEIINSNAEKGKKSNKEIKTLFENEKEINKNNKMVQEEFNTFDPEMFLIEEKNVLSEIISKVKARYDKEFNIFNEFFGYEKILCEFDIKETISFIEEQSKTTKGEFTEIMRSVDNKFSNYSENSKKEIKYSLLFKRILSEIAEIKKQFNQRIEALREKCYAADNLKNKNLLKLSIEEEIKNPNFKSYVIDKINRQGKLNTLLEEKANNDKSIAAKSTQIKKDEAYLLEKYFCVLCHKLPRNVLVRNCSHLVMCEVCVKTMKICPRCGIDIDGYDKIFR